MSAEALQNGAGDASEHEDIMAAAMEDGAYDELSEDDARLIELVGFLVQGIVAHPDEVEVEEFLDDLGSVYGVRVHPDDVGRVIGKEGRVANALRHVVKAAATKTGARVAVEIITDDSPINVVDSEEGSMPAGGEVASEGNNNGVEQGGDI
ncbi:MAG TPA: KH domain-containing protein [Abditibacteriaceae bacterium]|jgi:hypothetical protein